MKLSTKAFWLSSRLTELFLSQAICKTQPLPQEMLSNWADSARSALGEFYVLHAALDAISRQYFSGHDMLWPASREALGLRITVAEGMCERGKGLLEMCGRPSKFVRRLDPESIREPASRAAPAKVKAIVDFAKAKTLSARGDPMGAVAILRRHL